MKREVKAACWADSDVRRWLDAGFSVWFCRVSGRVPVMDSAVTDELHAVWTDQLLAGLHFGALLVSVGLRMWQRA
jgi:hypothetical protein